MLSETVVFIENPIFDLAEKFIDQTSRCIFLTGKAGTGKTTFLRKIRASTSKNTVVLAPTGVAAINAGGTTIHSFFQLPFSPFIPAHRRGDGTTLSDRYSLLQNLRIESEKRNLFRDLELLIIDEVSMVRCDVLDSIDIILRHFRRKENIPFGGVQLLFIGDLFQLPPVVQPQEWSILREFYESPFFFDAQVIREVQPLYIELKKIFRQRDEEFIGILNRVRSNEVTPGDISKLNDRFNPDFVPAAEDKFITLTTHNYKADKINHDELQKLEGSRAIFEASLEGDFPERSFPTDRTLLLKTGAQVMFIKNDVEKIRRYYNGKIATVTRIDEGRIFVTFPGEDGELEVEKDTWRNMRYTYHSGEKGIEEEVIGTFTQYPVRLAWAITIHKSQGLTFEKAIIDAGSSFASGQVYVALSRCTTLEGLVLKSRIFRQSVLTDARILEFANAELSEEKLRPMLDVERQQYLAEGLIRLFDFTILKDEVADLKKFVEGKKTINRADADAFLDKMLDTISRQQDVSDKFSNQLRQLVFQQDYPAVRKRVVQAIEYFQTTITTSMIGPLEDYHSTLKKLKRARKYLKKLSELKSLLSASHEILGRAVVLSEKLGADEIN